MGGAAETRRRSIAADFDGVTVDVRVTSDDVPVIAHSSPVDPSGCVDGYGLVIEGFEARSSPPG
jgi:hypothetical protein